MAVERLHSISPRLCQPKRSFLFGSRSIISWIRFPRSTIRNMRRPIKIPNPWFLKHLLANTPTFIFSKTRNSWCSYSANRIWIIISRQILETRNLSTTSRWVQPSNTGQYTDILRLRNFNHFFLLSLIIVFFLHTTTHHWLSRPQ